MSKRVASALACIAVLIAVSACTPMKKKIKGCVAPPAGMTAWWPLDETSGTTAQDIVGVPNNGTHSGGVTRDTHVAGTACYNGTNAFTTVPNHMEIDFQGDCSNDAAEAFTIDFWIRTTASSGVVTILDKRSAATNFLQGWSVYLYNGRVGFQMATGTGNQICGSAGSACTNFTSSFNVADGQWHFVAISASRCRGAAGTFYVDGATSSFHPRVGGIFSQSDLYFARRAPSLNADNYFPGCLDEVEIFKTIVPQSDLDAIYHAGREGKCKKKTY